MKRDEIILVLVIYGFGLCWVCIVFEEIYGMRRKMTKREMGNFRGVQKTDESNKPAKTDRPVAKFLVRFQFGSVSVLNF